MVEIVKKFAHRRDLHQSPMYADVMRGLDWVIEKNGKTQIFLRHLGPFAIAKIQRPGAIDSKWFTQIRRQYRTLTTYIEPSLTMPPYPKKGIGVEPFAHSQSSLIDLTLSEKDLISSFTQKTRYNITRNLKKGIVTTRTIPLGKETATDLKEFFSLRGQWSHKKNVVGYPESLLRIVIKSFRANGHLHCAYIDSQLIGALLILMNDKVATYYTALANNDGYAAFAPTLLTWHAFLHAKKSGCDIFDFGGTYDPRYPAMYKHWKGFTKFKEGFNPIPVTYPATSLHLGW